MASVMLALAVYMVAPASAAKDLGSLPTASLQAPAYKTTVYFGNGCFWGRHKEFIATEVSLGRTQPRELSAVVGYAGGKHAGPGNRVCYYHSDPATVYEGLGHAEVVQLGLGPGRAGEGEFRALARTYFAQFRRTEAGLMSRLDPQDAGPGYRNVVGIPGGVASHLFRILQEENVNGMELRQGFGGGYADGRPLEDDLLNVVWVLDSSQLPFYRAEQYHQFHNGLGHKFPTSYTVELKEGMRKAGKIDDTGCMEVHSDLI